MDLRMPMLLQSPICELSAEEHADRQVYEQYFKQLIEQENLEHAMQKQLQVTPEQLKYHKIQLLSSHPDKTNYIKQDDCYITIRKKQHYGINFIYDVIIGVFKLKVHLLSLQRNADQMDNQVINNRIGMGSFGFVRSVQVEDKQFAIKRITFKHKAYKLQNFDYQSQLAEHTQLQKAIRQYCIYKICSMLDIGPKVIFENNYDLVCFNDCMEFVMELCEVPQKNPNFCFQNKLQPQQFNFDLKNCVRRLHRCKFIHKDIKPDNILYSTSQGKFVLADFGMTHVIKEGYWQKTLTRYEGTLMYSSSQMSAIYEKNKGKVNLYLNDVHALKKTILHFVEKFVDCDLSMSENSMSFVESISNGNYFQDKVSIDFNKSISLRKQPPSEQFSNNGSNIPSLSTYHSNNISGPIKYASEINYYQSSVLYEICECMVNPTHQLRFQEVAEVVQRVCGCCHPEVIRSCVYQQVMMIFFPPFSQTQQYYLLMDLKNTTRHYGPSSQQTIYSLDQYITYLETTQLQEEIKYYQTLKSKLTSAVVPDKSILQNDFRIHRILNNNRSYIDDFMQLMRKVITDRTNLLKKRQIQPLTQEQTTFMQEYRMFVYEKYIRLQCLQELSMKDQQEIIKLLQKYQSLWGNTQHINQISDFKELTQQQILNFIDKIVLSMFNQLKQHNMALYKNSFKDLIAYHKNHFKFRQDNTVLDHLIDECLKEPEVDLNEHISKQILVAGLYKRRKQYEKSLEIIWKMQTIISKNDEMKLSVINFELMDLMATIYIDLNKLQSAENIIKRTSELKLQYFSEIQKGRDFAVTQKMLGIIAIKKGNYTESIEHLTKALKLHQQHSGLKNGIKLSSQIMNNIIYAYDSQKKYPQALEWANKLLYFRKEYANESQFQMIYLQDCMLRIKLKAKLISSKGDQIDDSQVVNLVHGIVHGKMRMLMGIRKENRAKVQEKCLQIFLFDGIMDQANLEHVVYVRKLLSEQLIQYLPLSNPQYKQINLDLTRYYFQQIHRKNEGMLYLWRYLEQVFRKINQATFQDYQLMNLYVHTLMKSNSYRRALKFLKRYISYIPKQHTNLRKRAYKMIYKLNHELGCKMAWVYGALIKGDCELLIAGNFQPIAKLPQNTLPQVSMLREKMLKLI